MIAIARIYGYRRSWHGPGGADAQIFHIIPSTGRAEERADISQALNLAKDFRSLSSELPRLQRMSVQAGENPLRCSTAAACPTMSRAIHCHRSAKE